MGQKAEDAGKAAPADVAEHQMRAPVLDEDRAELLPEDGGPDEAKAVDLPIEENQFNVQPG